MSRPYLPPPPDDRPPESLGVPRMEPPPSSLQAMIRSQPGAPLPRQPGSFRFAVFGVLVLLVALAYYFGLRR